MTAVNGNHSACETSTDYRKADQKRSMARSLRWISAVGRFPGQCAQQQDDSWTHQSMTSLAPRANRRSGALHLVSNKLTARRSERRLQRALLGYLIPVLP
jgi:hypothetical protein